MSSLEQLEDILGTLHDGSIVAWAGDYSRLTLTIDCQYIAEQRQPGLTLFYVELTDVTALSLEVWADNEPRRHELAAVFAGELEINHAAVETDCVLVTCYQFDRALPCQGGNLRMACAAVRVFDQARTPLSAGELRQLSQAGYDAWVESHR